jgi:hypothetical protein
VIFRWFDSIFGCKHKNLSFPQQPPRGRRMPQAALLTGYYVACTDCGREFPYDWQNMRVIPDERKRDRRSLMTLAERSAL